MCLVHLPNKDTEKVYHACCGNMICLGCDWKHRQVLDKTNAKRALKAKTNAKRALKDPPKPPLKMMCAFCREPAFKTNEKFIERCEARMALNDPKAFEVVASYFRAGKYGLTQDERKAFELYLRAAELGSANACYNVSCMYRDGEGVERDISKQEHYLKLAAKKGHIGARYNLGCVEAAKGNVSIAVRHWMMSASAGDDDSLVNIGIVFRQKRATKDQYEEAIRAKHAAKKEMQSEERDKAKAFYGI